MDRGADQRVDVFCGRRLRKYLRREAAGRSSYLDECQIEAIHDIAVQVLPPLTDFGAPAPARRARLRQAGGGASRPVRIRAMMSR